MPDLELLDTVSKCVFCDRRLVSDNFVVFERRDGCYESWCVDCYKEHMVPTLAGRST